MPPDQPRHSFRHPQAPALNATIPMTSSFSCVGLQAAAAFFAAELDGLRL